LFEDGKTRQTRGDKATKGGFSTEAAEVEKKRKGKLSRAALLRCRVRYFSDGLVLGTKSYVDGVFEAYRGHFGPKRTSGARALREDAQGSLFTARQLAVRTVG
jgi:hypothetical protein